MANFPPLVTAMTDSKGIATPFWNKYFTQQFADEALLRELPASTLLGRGSEGAGAVEAVTLGDRLSFSDTVLNVNVDDLPLANLVDASAASRLLGRGSASAGSWQELTLGSGLTLAGTVLSASGSGGTIGGNVGATDNRIVRADGTGGATIQGSAAALDDSGNLTIAGLTVNTHAVTVNGAATIDNWFNQDVRTTASPTFDNMDANSYSVGGTGGDSGDFNLDISGGGSVRLKVVNGLVTIYA